MTPTKLDPISGFPEWTPAMCLLEQRLTRTIRECYELFGFTPIETPAVERMSVLMAKGGIQRQIFTVGRPADDAADGEARLGLHFDLTVPLARYVAQHAEELAFPFRRYQIQKVWRGERAQRGRFREFTQCDIDIVGAGSLDLVHDAEILAVVNAVFDALQVPRFEIRVSNRKVLDGLFAARSLTPDQATAGLRTIDKHGRQQIEATHAALVAEGFAPDLAGAVTELIESESLSEARKVLQREGAPTDGVDELDVVIDSSLQLGIQPSRLRVDYAIARGLDYYTGTVYETFISGHEGWGSVCSGGRYDDLSSYFSRRSFPGVGVSIGMTRLLDLLVQGEYIAPQARTPTAVLVTMQDRRRFLRDYLGLARTLRMAQIPTEVFLEPATLRDQIAYASTQGIRVAVIAGEQELERDTVAVRDLRHHVQDVVTGDQMVWYIKNLLGL